LNVYGGCCNLAIALHLGARECAKGIFANLRKMLRIKGLERVGGWVCVRTRGGGLSGALKLESLSRPEGGQTTQKKKKKKSLLYISVAIVFALLRCIGGDRGGLCADAHAPTHWLCISAYGARA
jgi:hypothetical protein